ncbi:MAG: AraC family ligand binding domain-containing protein [Opitutaceae bacterium]
MSKRLRTTHTPRVYFGDVIYEPGGGFGPRVQMDFQLVVLIAGEARVTVDDRTTQWNAGQVALLHPGHNEMFRFSEHRPTHHTWCALDPGLVPRRTSRMPCGARSNGSPSTAPRPSTCARLRGRRAFPARSS